ncbi:MAG: response regulator [Defluviitaleaceae bacterium]|nr:response regulator [Defluviitaleaceae bacterium]
MTVLIVDDTGIMRMILKDILIKFAGLKAYDIHEAADGREALQKYPIVKPHVVFLDIAMPDIDGIAAVRELMQRDPSAKIIMCTSSSDQTDIRDCIRAGAIDYIKKPPRPERVMQAYEKAVGKPASTEESAEPSSGESAEPTSAPEHGELKPAETAKPFRVSPRQPS